MDFSETKSQITKGKLIIDSPNLLLLEKIRKKDMGFQKINMRSRFEKVDFFFQVNFLDSCKIPVLYNFQGFC